MKGNVMLMPAVWGGLVIGVLSALPFVSVLNFCCCLWVVAGGMVAAYLLQANTTGPITLGDGAVVGLLAGLIGSVVNTIISVPINLVFGGLVRGLIQQVASSAPDLPDNVRQMLETIQSSPSFSLLGVVIGFFFFAVVGSIFAALGGLLGAVFFKKKIVDPAGA